MYTTTTPKQERLILTVKHNRMDPRPLRCRRSNVLDPDKRNRKPRTQRNKEF